MVISKIKKFVFFKRQGIFKRMESCVASSDRIIMMEDHDKAYNAWKAREVRARTLVHVDAHIDFGWIPEVDFDEISSSSSWSYGQNAVSPLLNPFIKSRKKMVNIGNYICPAMREGMVEKFYWIVPGESWRRRRGVKHIMRQLKRILKIKRRAGGRLEVHENCIRCRVLGKEIIVCSLENLAPIDEPVLLDIDVDFMLTRHIWDDLNPDRTPWIFSEELFEKLSQKVLKIDILTIAYSVEGGFTPLRFKYMGDELRSLYARELSESARAIMEIKKKALSYEMKNNMEAAAGAYEDALKIDSGDASLYFNRSIIRTDTTSDLSGKKEAYYFGEAIRRDKTYATAYNNYGILYLQYGKLKKAEVEYKKALRLDENNTAVLSGLGHIFLAKKRYVEAEEYFDRSLLLDRKHTSARLGKGVANFKSGRLSQAEEIFSGIKDDAPDDPEIYWWLGRIAERRGSPQLAIASYKSAVIRGGDGPLIHLKLFRLYMIRGLYYRAYEELKRFFHMIKAFY